MRCYFNHCAEFDEAVLNPILKVQHALGAKWITICTQGTSMISRMGSIPLEGLCFPLTFYIIYRFHLLKFSADYFSLLHVVPYYQNSSCERLW